MMRVFIPTDKAWENLSPINSADVPYVELIEKFQGQTVYLPPYNMEKLVQVASRIPTDFVFRELVEPMSVGDLMQGRIFVMQHLDGNVIYVYSNSLYKVRFDVFEQTFGYAQTIYGI